MIDPNVGRKAIMHSLQEVKQLHGMIDAEYQEIWAMLENRSLNQQQIKHLFGDFDFEDIQDDRIRVTDNFYAENIRLLDVCGHKIWVHKLIAGQLAAAITESVMLGFGKSISFENGGGGYCARRMRRRYPKEPLRGLSTHAYGISTDFDPVMYPYGSDKVPPNQVIQTFAKYGFMSGSSFRHKDGMHMEFARSII